MDKKSTYILFLPGDGSHTFCEVSHIADFARGRNGTCAFCNGDPCAEHSPGSPIEKYMNGGPYREYCPFCKGKPS